MKCRFKYDRSGYAPKIICQVRYPFEVDLSADDETNVIRCLAKDFSVPEEFGDMRSLIRQTYSQAQVCLSKDLCLVTTRNGKRFVEMLLTFRTATQFEHFVKENELVVEPF